MKKSFNQKGSRALALSMLGGSVLSPVVVSADNIFGPIQTEHLKTLESDQKVRTATADDLGQATKTGDSPYTITFGEDKEGSIEEGAEFLIYPAYLTLKNGQSVKLDGSKDEEIQKFIEDHSRVATAGEEGSVVQLDIDAIYHMRQIKRAPGSYLNPMLSEEGRRDEGFYGKGETLGFEFPKMENGVISNEQNHTVDPKDTEVDSGTNEPLIGGTDTETIIGNILVAKYGDESKDLGHITEDNSFDEVDESFGIETLKGARFTIRQLKKPVETERDFIKDITIGNSENYEGAKEDKERNKATFEEVEDTEYFAELNVDQDNISITGNKDEFDGLPEGVYEIDEIQAPEGFMRTEMKIKITVTVAENGIDRIVMVGDGSEDRVDGKGLYKVSSDESYNYGLKVNNYRKPGTDPEKPIDKDKENKNKPLIKEVVVDGEDQEGYIPGLNPGEFFDYRVDFTLPKDIKSYQYLEVYDKFDSSIKIDKLSVSVKSGEQNLILNEDFKVHKNESNQTKVVFTQSGIGKLDDSEIVSVNYKDVRFSEDLTSEEVQNILDKKDEEEKGIGYISNIAKLHFVNGSGDTVNPKDPEKKPTKPGEENPHMKPNPEDPFNPTEEVELPKTPEDSDDIRVPDVPTTEEVLATPIARDFEFVKINKSGEVLSGAEFELTWHPLESDDGDDGIEDPGIGDQEPDDEEEPESFMRLQKDGIVEKDDGLYVDGHKLKDRKIKATSDENGVVRFEGLPLGRYEIKETKAPEGYRLTNEPIELTITTANKDGHSTNTNMIASYDNQTVEVYGSSLIITDNNEGLKVINYKFNETPKTGTLGKTMYIGAGALVLTIGALGLKKKED